MSEGTELVKIETLDVTKIFAEGGMTKILEEIKIKATSESQDVGTATGRKAIASMAARVAASKTLLDGLGKDLVSGWKKKAGKVDKERKSAREFLDALKVKVRQPLTDYEAEQDAIAEAEKSRLQAIVESKVQDFLNFGVIVSAVDVAKMSDQEFAEKLNEATEAHRAKMVAEKAEQEAREAEAKRLLDEAAQLKADNAKLRQREAELAAEQAKFRSDQRILNVKTEALLRFNVALLPADVAKMSDQEFAEVLTKAKNDHEEKQAAAKAEQDKIAEDTIRVAQQAAAVKAERAKLEADQEARDRIDRLAKEAEEKTARDKAEERRKEAEAEARRKEAEADALRKEALMPDLEKINTFGTKLRNALTKWLPMPDIKDKKMMITMAKERQKIMTIAETLENFKLIE